jgi:hypothetical protein
MLTNQFRSSIKSAGPTGTAEFRSRQAWADMLDDSVSETEVGDSEAGDDKAGANLFNVTPEMSGALTSSLRIQSFSGLHSSSDVADQKSLGSSERLGPCVLEHSTPFLACEAHLRTAEFRRVSVPVQHPEGHRHGYAALLGLAQHKPGKSSRSTRPCIEAILSSKADVQVCAVGMRST